MLYKRDWDSVKRRYEAWWAGESVDGPITLIFGNCQRAQQESGWNGWNFAHNLDNPAAAVEAYLTYARDVHFAGDAYPNLDVNFGPGIMAAFIGAQPIIGKDTVWFETPMSLDEIEEKLTCDADNPWWKRLKDATVLATELGDGKVIVDITDLGGNLDIVASLRGTQNLLFDLIDCPERVKSVTAKVNQLWFRYYEELARITQRSAGGTSSWMNIWCPGRWYPLQCDFSAMISPQMFEELAAPYLAEQCRRLDHSIFHLDGPAQIPHLEILLDIPELDGIQWTPGAGSEPLCSRKWFPLYKRIQQRGKRIVLIGVDPKDMDAMMDELSPEGLFLYMHAETEKDAREILSRIRKWPKR